MPECYYCHSENVEFLGADDGGGDYGDSVCDIWHCHDCGQEYEVNCVGGEEDGFDAEAYGNKDITDDLGYAPADGDDIPY